MATVLDSLKSKPTFSAHLVASSPGSNSEENAIQMLSHLTTLLGDKRFHARSSQAFTSDRSRVEELRMTLSHIIDQVLSLSRQSRSEPKSMSCIPDLYTSAHSSIVGDLCHKLLNILLGGLPTVEFIKTLRGLLAGADIQVSSFP